MPVAKIVLQGAAVGLISGLVGAGGGFLLVPALALLGGLPMPVAVATSLVGPAGRRRGPLSRDEIAGPRVIPRRVSLPHSPEGGCPHGW
ncbi:MAG: sulfite exporter TauE/SafE family protein [Mycobacterium sp.]|nr:sulfite exporter TauE/SafE family protein [Mycobacterium sp.]